MSVIARSLSELKRIEEEISMIQLEVDECKLHLMEISREILKKFREEVEAEIIEDRLGEIKEELKKRYDKEERKILENAKKELTRLSDRGQQKMDELVEIALKMILDSG